MGSIRLLSLTLPSSNNSNNSNNPISNNSNTTTIRPILKQRNISESSVVKKVAFAQHSASTSNYTTPVSTANSSEFHLSTDYKIHTNDDTIEQYHDIENLNLNYLNDFEDQESSKALINPSINNSSLFDPTLVNAIDTIHCNTANTDNTSNKINMVNITATSAGTTDSQFYKTEIDNINLTIRDLKRQKKYLSKKYRYSHHHHRIIDSILSRFM